MSPNKKSTKVSHPPSTPQSRQSDSPLLDRIIRVHLYLLIFLIPLIFWPDTLTVFTLPKLLVLRGISISSGIFILLKLFLSSRVTLRFSRNFLFLGFWLLSLVLSTIFTLNLDTSLFGQYGRYLGFFTMLNFLLIPVFIVNFFTASESRKLLSATLIASSLVALYGLLQYFNFFGLVKFPYDWSDSPQSRVFGTLGHANHLGGYLAAHALILLYHPGLRWLKKGSVLSKILYSLILLIHLITLVLTASRGAILAFILGLAVCLIVGRITNHRHKSSHTQPHLIGTKPAKSQPHNASTRTISSFSLSAKRFALYILPILLLFAITGSALYYYRDSLSGLGLFKRTEATVETIGKGIIPDRISFLYSSLAMWADHPITGTGLSTFRDAYSAYRRADYAIDGPGNAQNITVPEAAHNEYANILATQGSIGFVAYLLMIFAAYRLLYLALRRADTATHGEDRNYYLALWGGLSVYLFQTIFNFGEINNLFLFYLLLGLIFSIGKASSKSFSLRGALAGIVKFILVFMMLVALVFAFMLGVIQEGRADYYLRNARLDDMNKLYSHVDMDYQLAISARPQEYSLYQFYGDFLLATGASSQNPTVIEQAIENYEKSLQLNNNYPSTHHNLALAYLQIYRITRQAKYSESSRQNYQLSVDKAPNNPRYPYEFARKLHTDFDDVPAAITMLRKSIAIAPNYQEPQDYLNFLYKNYPALR